MSVLLIRKGLMLSQHVAILWGNTESRVAIEGGLSGRSGWRRTVRILKVVYSI
jgi:hypothetical protein